MPQKSPHKSETKASEDLTPLEKVDRGLITINQFRVMQGLPEICEWCKGPVRMMVQKGTGVCSQNCARLASDILFDSQEKAEKFGGGFGGDA